MKEPELLFCPAIERSPVCLSRTWKLAQDRIKNLVVEKVIHDDVREGLRCNISFMELASVATKADGFDAHRRFLSLTCAERELTVVRDALLPFSAHRRRAETE